MGRSDDIDRRGVIPSVLRSTYCEHQGRQESPCQDHTVLRQRTDGTMRIKLPGQLGVGMHRLRHKQEQHQADAKTGKHPIGCGLA